MVQAGQSTAPIVAADGVPGEGALPRPAEPPMAIARLVSECVVDYLRVSAAFHGCDFVDTVILTAVFDANVRHLWQDPELNRRYAGAAFPLPDELRRPVSINGLAQSLGLPFETTRRRVHALSRRELCFESKGGLLLKESRFVTAPAREALGLIHLRLSRLYTDLGRMAPDYPMILGDVEAGPPLDDPTRLSARAAARYVLRYVEASMPAVEDLVSGVILLTVAVDSVRHVTSDEGLSGKWNLEGQVVPDAERRPLKNGEIADRLGLPRETVRRRVAKLILDGVCVRRGAGVHVSAEAHQRPEFMMQRVQNAANVRRMFTDLHRLGVRFG